MQLTLSPEQRSLREEFRAFAETEVMPLAAQHDAAERIDAALVGELMGAGYLGALVPGRYGGRALDHIAYGLLHEEIGRACSATRSLLTVHDMVADAVHRRGSQAQREALLPLLGTGKVVGALALTEPEAGSDVTALSTAAAPVPGGYAITGIKRWISFATMAAVFLVFARTPEGISAFLVERDQAGLEIVPMRGLLGARASMLGELRFTSCVVPRSAVLGPLGRAHPFITTSSLTLGRYSVASGAIGVVQGCFEASRRHAAVRGLVAHQLVQRLIASMATAAEAGRLLTLQAGELIAAGSPRAPVAALQAKLFATVSAGNAARDAVQIHGAIGCSQDHAVSRYFRDAKVMEIIEGSTEIAEAMIGQFEQGRLIDSGR